MKLLHRPISASDWISDRFCVISVEFLSLSRSIPPRETSLSSDEREETSAVRRLGAINNHVPVSKILGEDSNLPLHSEHCLSKF